MRPNATADTGASSTEIPATVDTFGWQHSGVGPASPQAPAIRFKPRVRRQIQSQPDVIIPATGELKVLYTALFEVGIAAQVAAEKYITIKEQIAQVLSRMRKERGWSLGYVSEMIDIGPSDLMHIEQGVSVPRDSTLRKWLATFGYCAPTPPMIFTSRLTAYQIKKGTKYS